jgi:hypothetical protein
LPSEISCFSAGFRHRDPFLFVFFVLLQFHAGIRMTPITKARTEFFNPEKALIAVQRGAAMNVDLTDGWDYLAGHGRAGRGAPEAVQHPPLGGIQDGKSAGRRESHMTKELWFKCASDFRQPVGVS